MSEHAIREYLKTIGNGGGGVSQETDPVFTASPAHGISAQDIADWNDKQEELVSGTNIKTINGQSLLGSGDLPVAPPVTSTDVPTADTIAEFDSDAHMNSTDMTAQEVSDFVDGLNISGMELGDFVVEQGTSGIWTYRKWNSGIAECWGTASLTPTWVSYTAGLYFSSPQPTISYPFTITDAIVTANPNVVGSDVGWVANVMPHTSNVELTIVRNGSTGDATVQVSVKGKWK